ncbi:SDR family NAD(P)-dependent oxidoreductase [Priestia aryabhattai]|uniref:SDR family NAD(P)-dependent oxidoreductase n=1 Tax=Priestia aryabhattai TaxID=412384 RepID=UPI001873BCE0|nr:SDR family NAD(P)-dependent oxidoreductase [Priestia aryabhattai]MBE5102256.1 SDR family oxidoreductase [Priestia aryabhattai]
MIKDKVAVVTGATRGIGKEVAVKLATNGAKVIGIYARSDKTANEIKDELSEKGHEITFYKGLVNDKEFVRTTIEEVISQYGKIDILVNNAGINRDNFIFQTVEEDWNDVFQTNFGGTYHFCNEVIPYMVEQKSGNIINMVSVSAVNGREAQTNYGCSKGAIVGLTRMLSRIYSPHGLRINAVAPGMIETEMIQHVPDKKLNNFVHHTNTQSLGQAKQVANTVLFLAQDEDSYFTNTVFKLDGGFLR